jgi:hypothetical protein
MLISMAAASPGMSPDDVAGIAVAAVTMATGIGAATRSELRSEHLHRERVEVAARLAGIWQPGTATEALQDLQFKEMRFRFRESRIYSRLFLLMIILFAVVFLSGSVSLILGFTTAHVVTLLASAIPGVGSVLFKYASNVSMKQSDEAFKTLTKRVEDAEAADRREAAITKMNERASRDALKAIEAIKSIVPDATPEQLASIFKDLPATSRATEKEGERP